MKLKLDELKKLTPENTTKRGSLDRETGLEILAAFRRGVRIKSIADAAGMSSSNIYAALGTWALHHCQCGKEGK